MAEVKWIKICTDIFDDEKILLIENMPEADGIIVIWFKLLCMAGKQNNSGVFMMNERIAYTDEMLATIFRRPINTVRLALKVFEQYGMIEIVDGAITIPNWEKHQNLDKLEQAKEKNRQRVARHREKQKQLALQDKCNDYSNDDVMQCNDTDKIRLEEDKNRLDIDKRKNIDYEQIKDLYNEICISFPRLTVLSDSRKKAIKARLHTYTIEQFKQMFEMAEQSDFLKGANNRDWSANFDWLIKDANFAKVLEGNYNNNTPNNKAQQGYQRQQPSGNVFLELAKDEGIL